MSVPERLKLGKGSAFVKSQLKHLPFLPPEDNNDWEVDFQQLPGNDGGMDGWFGMVIGQEFGGVFADRHVAEPPTVNDLATMLGDAMRRPFDGPAHRPRTIFLRDRMDCQELIPHLREIGIRVELVEKLATWDEAYEEFVREVVRGR